MTVLEQIAGRVREMREIIGMDAEEIAGRIGVSVGEYMAYENAENDIPIGKLYLIADELGLDPTVLLTGEMPKMADYTLVRAGHGISVERYAGYRFSSLAYNFKSREMEPMIVTMTEKDGKPDLVSHEGQEFNYVISGTIGVTINDREFILNEGDSIYFNPVLPHGQRAIGGEGRFLMVINERMKGKK